MNYSSWNWIPISKLQKLIIQIFILSNSFSNRLLIAAAEELVRQAVTTATLYKTGYLPSTLDVVFSKYSCSILPINHLTPLGKSDHAALQVNFALPKIPAEMYPNKNVVMIKLTHKGLCVLLTVSTGPQYHKLHAWTTNGTKLRKSSCYCKTVWHFRSSVTTKNTSLAQDETQTCPKKWTFGVRPQHDQHIGLYSQGVQRRMK